MMTTAQNALREMQGLIGGFTRKGVAFAMLADGTLQQLPAGLTLTSKPRRRRRRG